MGTLRRVISWVEIGLGLPLALLAAFVVYSAIHMEPTEGYIDDGGGLFAAFMIGGVGIGLTCGGLGLRSRRALIWCLAHAPLLVSAIRPLWLRDLIDWGYVFLTR